MKTLIENFPQQLTEALAIGNGAQLNSSNKGFKSILITGLGGSGIGGTILMDTIGAECKIPIQVNKDYLIPAWVNEDTLLIACSYSGNTEETLVAMEHAAQRKCEIACITSGGKLLELATEKEYNYIQIPSGHPPRACLGYSLTQLYFLLNHHGIISDAFKTQLNNAIGLITDYQAAILEESKTIASALYQKIPAIYSSAQNEGIAIRFRQQVNENAKMLCWHHVLPEMNHNELVGWADNHSNVGVLVFRSTNDYARTQTRMNLFKDLVSKKCGSFTEVWAKGESSIEQSIYLIHLGDWVSWFLSEMKQIDATEVDVITYLKGELAKEPV